MVTHIYFDWSGTLAKRGSKATFVYGKSISEKCETIYPGIKQMLSRCLNRRVCTDFCDELPYAFTPRNQSGIGGNSDFAKRIVILSTSLHSPLQTSREGSIFLDNRALKLFCITPVSSTIGNSEANNENNLFKSL